MKFVLPAIAAALVAAPLAAQTAPATRPMPVPAVRPMPAPAATPVAPVAGPPYTLDTPIQTLVADPKAKAAVDAALGADITQNPFYEQIKPMSFNQVQPMSQGQLTDDMMKKIATGLATVK